MISTVGRISFETSGVCIVFCELVGSGVTTTSVSPSVVVITILSPQTSVGMFTSSPSGFTSPEAPKVPNGVNGTGGSENSNGAGCEVAPA